ncbi:MAG: hypothetical protein QXV17_01470 [Candidatus Micrarchaeaceae archaeon]
MQLQLFCELNDTIEMNDSMQYDLRYPGLSEPRNNKEFIVDSLKFIKKENGLVEF